MLFRSVCFDSRPGYNAGELDGCRSGAFSGTLLHAIFENDAFRRSYLGETARIADHDFISAGRYLFCRRAADSIR